MFSILKRVPEVALRYASDPASMRLDWLSRRLIQERRTYLGFGALHDLHGAVRRAERRATPGAIVEAGTALGGSAILLAASKRPARPLFVYDAFEGMPEPGERDGPDVHKRYEEIRAGNSPGIGGDPYYGYRRDLYNYVADGFATFGLPIEDNNVTLVKGYFQDTLFPDLPIAVAHIDADWYESVRVCLERVAPRLVAGGTIIVDDYFTYSGCRQAVDEFLQSVGGFRKEVRSRLHLIREASQRSASGEGA